MSLNKKQQRFVNEYIVDLNATKSAIRSGYSEKTAAVQGCQLLKLPKISAAIQRAMDERAGRLQITQDNVLQELAKLAFLDARKFYAPDGSLIPVTELDDNTAACLQGIEIEEAYQHFGKGQAKATGVLKKIKFADKGINLERLGRHLKLFTDKLEVDVGGSLAERLERIRKRVVTKESQNRAGKTA